jgi:hypothetical protein
MALYNAGRGDLTKGYAFAGANAWRSERITTVHETMRTLTEEYEAEERSSGE